jgi:DNA topoisomerase-1
MPAAKKKRKNKALVIVESPAKAKTIKKYLPRGYAVEATMGHVIDLPKSKLGVDIEDNYNPHYINIRGKGSILKTLRESAKKSDDILLATDPDREGEAISWHVANYLNIDPQAVCRIEFNEITKKAITSALDNKRVIDIDTVNSQQARRIVDRLVGYTLSPLLWKKVKKGLSAGRVQSVATKMIVLREQEIKNFKPEEYWNIELLLCKTVGHCTFKAKYYGRNNKKNEVLSHADADKIKYIVENNKLIVKDIKKKIRKKASPLPFTTSSLQQEANNKLGFSAKKTMMIAQQLYEGIKLPDLGLIGLITYIRTDSTRLSDDAVGECYQYIGQNYGNKYKGRVKSAKKNNNIQDAHEAIRATSVYNTPLKVKDALTPEQYKLYRLIWLRYLTSLMADAKYDATTVDITCDTELFRAQGSIMQFDGFTKVYEEHGINFKDNDNIIPEDIECEDVLYLERYSQEQKFTQPPSRYTEAALVKAMEEKGIGRPSTYAPTISTIMNRGYVEKENKKFYPTELGFIVTDFMDSYFKDIINIHFTAELEKELDLIGEGKREWKEVIDEFYQPFEKDLNKAEVEAEKIKIQDPVSDVQCEKCGRMMVIKRSKYGKFLACPGFPECENTKVYLEKTGANCPECGGDIVKKKSKKGRTYFGCANNPECDFMTWDQPTKKKCPKCNHSLFKKGYGDKAIYYCINDDCDYQVSVRAE